MVEQRDFQLAGRAGGAAGAERVDILDLDEGSQKEPRTADRRDTTRPR
jgi:hypothetical protein